MAVRQGTSSLRSEAQGKEAAIVAVVGKAFGQNEVLDSTTVGQFVRSFVAVERDDVLGALARRVFRAHLKCRRTLTFVDTVEQMAVVD